MKEFEESLNPSELIQYVKNYCVADGNPIPGTVDWYLVRGNYCSRSHAELLDGFKGEVKRQELIRLGFLKD